MARIVDLLLSYLVVVGATEDKTTKCAQICRIPELMMHCCDCIGCHQGMRFGKRASKVNYEVLYSNIQDERIPKAPDFTIVSEPSITDDIGEFGKPSLTKIRARRSCDNSDRKN